MNYSVFIPISFNQFISAFESCQSIDQLKPKLGFKNIPENPTLAAFLKEVKFPLLSYKDLTIDKWFVFKKKVEQLFPNQSDEDKRVFEKLNQRIKDEFNKIFYPEKITGFRTDFRITLTDDQGKQEKKLITTSEMLEIIENELKAKPSNRLLYAVKDCQDDAKKLAGTLQVASNLIIQEIDLLLKITAFLKEEFKVRQMCGSLCQDSAFVVDVAVGSKAIFFEIPELMENAEEFGFWLNLSPYLVMAKNEGRLYASFQNASKSEISVEKLRAHLTELRKATTNKSLNFIVDKIQLILDMQPVLRCYLNKFIDLEKRYKEISNSLIQNHPFTDSFELLISPCGHSAINILNRWYLYSITNDPEELPIEIWDDLKKIVDFWKININEQRAFFDLLQETLTKLLQTVKKEKKEFLQYTKDLTAPKGTEPAYQRNFPTDENLFLLSSSPFYEKEKVEDKREIVQVSKDVPKDTSSERITKKERKKKKKAIEIEKNETLVIESDPLPNQLDHLKIEKEIQEVKSESKQEALSFLEKGISGTPFPYSYDQRVERWHAHPFGEPLDPNLFSEYADKDAEYQQLMHLFHHPHLLVDQFLSLGIQEKIMEKKTNRENMRFIIPAEIQYKGKNYRGIMTYAIDSSSGVCYHKFFTSKVDREIVHQMITRTFDERDFPPLSPPSKSSKIMQQFKSSDLTNVKIDKSGNVRINDPEKHTIIHLFNTQME